MEASLTALSMSLGSRLEGAKPGVDPGCEARGFPLFFIDNQSGALRTMTLHLCHVEVPLRSYRGVMKVSSFNVTLGGMNFILRSLADFV